jgi:hypothetical protein
MIVLAREHNDRALPDRGRKLADQPRRIGSDEINVSGLAGMLDDGLDLDPLGAMNLAVVEDVHSEFGRRYDELSLMILLARLRSIFVGTSFSPDDGSGQCTAIGKM